MIVVVIASLVVSVAGLILIPARFDRRDSFDGNNRRLSLSCTCLHTSSDQTDNLMPCDELSDNCISYSCMQSGKVQNSEVLCTYGTHLEAGE